MQLFKIFSHSMVLSWLFFSCLITLGCDSSNSSSSDGSNLSQPMAGSMMDPMLNLTMDSMMDSESQDQGTPLWNQGGMMNSNRSDMSMDSNSGGSNFPNEMDPVEPLPIEMDQDQDGVDDRWDPEPNNPDWPGRTKPNTVYAHTATTLYALDVKREELLPVCEFSFNTSDNVPGDEMITDIAISRAGVLWAISFKRLYLCHPRTGECRVQGQLSDNSSLNGLTFLPTALVDREQDLLVGIDQFGEWLALTTGDPDEEVQEETLGTYGLGNRSSGDVFAIEGVGAFASIKQSGEEFDLIAAVDPNRILFFDEVLRLDGYSAVYGLAGWRGVLFAFDESGAILRIRLETLEVEEIHRQDLAWWGAGVSPVLSAVQVEK